MHLMNSTTEDDSIRIIIIDGCASIITHVSEYIGINAEWKRVTKIHDTKFTTDDL